MANSRLEEIRSARISKLTKLRELGINPYPAKYSQPSIPITQALTSQGQVGVTGRIVSWREHGNVIFAHLKDQSAKIQILFQKKSLTQSFSLLKLFDPGDYLGVTGEIVTSNTGEITIDVTHFELLSKSVRPLPDDWHGLKDIEDRYRKRYLDILLNQQVRDRFQIRTQILRETRNYLDGLGFSEVETPIFHPLYGGANARPFTTHMHALDSDYYLRIAFELYLKRLVIGGFDKVYEIGRDFRNEGIDHSHNPEFTMLEWYEAYADYHRVMDVTEGLFKHLATAIFGQTQVTVGSQLVEIGTPWPRIPMPQLLQTRLGHDVLTASASDLVALAKQHSLELVGGETAGQIIFMLFDKLIAPNLIEPTFVIDYPQDVSPLSKPKPDQPGWVERFEGYIGGKEICDGWSELTDPQIQRQRFEFDVNAARKDKTEAQQVDEDFLEAMEYGMPPTGGIGIGIDRLTMFFTNTWTLKEVILFPTLRPR
jgi:lysyl-tRNA synthetase class 2